LLKVRDSLELAVACKIFSELGTSFGKLFGEYS